MICRVVTIVFAVAYLLALLVFLTGTFGWFGQDTDPLSGLFLIPLGLPWNLIPVPEGWLTFSAIAAPLLNLVLIVFVCRRFAQSKSGKN